MTPLGFIPLQEAVRQCADAWGIDDANSYERLRAYLNSLHIDSQALFGDGEPKNIGYAWAASINDQAYNDGKLRFDDGQLDGPIALPSFVHAEQLRRLLRDADESRGPGPDVPQDKSRGGRPRNADEDLFWIEVCRAAFVGEQASQGEASHTQKAFIDAMLIWASKNMAKPWKEGTVELKIEALWKVLHPRGKN